MARTPTIPTIPVDRDTVDAARDAVVTAAEVVAETAAARWDDAVSAASTVADEASARWDDAVTAARRATGRTKWYERIPTWGWVAAGGTVVVAGVVVYRRRRAAAEAEDDTVTLERTGEDAPLGAASGEAVATAAPTGTDTVADDANAAG